MPEPDTINDTVYYEDKNIYIASGAKYNLNGSVAVNGIPANDPMQTGDINPGQAAFSRYLITNSATSVLASTALQLTYFRGNRTESINNIRTMSSATATSAPTMCRLGIYQVNEATGDLTLTNSTTHDAVLWSVINTIYTKTLTSTFNKVAGQLYAVAFLYVGAATPSLVGINSPSNGTDPFMAPSPKLAARFSSQSDLPANITNAQATASRIILYAEMTP